MLFPLKVRSLAGGHPVVARIAARTCQMQGMPEVHYEGTLNAEQRASHQRGVYCVLAALESLGCELYAPAELSPTLPHDRER